jgi:hypothetical protein
MGGQGELTPQTSEGRSASDLSVGALLYRVSRDSVSATWCDSEGSHEAVQLGRITALLPKLEELRVELRDGMAVARCRTPLLDEFACGWGRSLLPASIRDSPPDVLVVVPHAVLHDVPLHLVCVEEHLPLGCVTGVSYASSRSLFARCAARNVARCRDFRGWRLDESEVPSGARDRSFVGGGYDVVTAEYERFASIPRLIAQLFGDPVLLPGGASRDVKYVIKMNDPDVLFLVAHGYIDPDDHRMSGLMVGQGIGVTRRAISLHGGRLFRFRDLPLTGFPVMLRANASGEVLTAAELEIDVHARIELAVLLACSAGAGRVVQGDRPASIAETLLHVGAASVIAPMWDTDFGWSREWIVAYFTAWMKLGYPKALAVRYAMRHIWAMDGGREWTRLGPLALRGDWV